MKKVHFIDASTPPTGKHVTISEHFPVYLLLVIKNIPNVVMGTYTVIPTCLSGQKPSSMMLGYNVPHCYTFKQEDVLAWRPVPVMPEEYRRDTGRSVWLANRELEYEKIKKNLAKKQRAKDEEEE